MNRTGHKILFHCIWWGMVVVVFLLLLFLLLKVFDFDVVYSIYHLLFDEVNPMNPTDVNRIYRALGTIAVTVMLLLGIIYLAYNVALCIFRLRNRRHPFVTVCDAPVRYISARDLKTYLFTSRDLALSPEVVDEGWSMADWKQQFYGLVFGTFFVGAIFVMLIIGFA